MRALVFQHIAVEHPGIFRDFFAEDGVDWDAVELDEGERIPALDGYDILVSMGGPMDVWEEAEHPWLVAEKAAIRDWVAAGKPFLGFCLGHQLLADALGGEVGLAPVPEVGVMEVDLTNSGVEDPFFAGVPERFVCMQWHSVAVNRLPDAAVSLAHSDDCPVQAFRVGAVAYGIQFHIEVTEATASEWVCVPAYEESLRATMGEGALQRLETDMSAALPGFRRTARTLYDNFMALARAS